MIKFRRITVIIALSPRMIANRVSSLPDPVNTSAQPLSEQTSIEAYPSPSSAPLARFPASGTVLNFLLPISLV